MADDKSSGSWGSSFVVVAFAAVSALYVAWQRPPLISTRPTDPQYHAYKSTLLRMLTQGSGRTRSMR